MSSYEKTARLIMEALLNQGLLRDDLRTEAELLQIIINGLLEGNPGRNDVLQEAFLVANMHKQMYPESVFPANGLTPDAWAARGCRLVAANIGSQILRLQDPC